MICPKCSSPNKEGDKFCRKCGATLVAGDMPQTADVAVAPQSACPKCGATVNPGNKFCAACGTVLDVVSSQGAPTPTLPTEENSRKKSRVLILVCVASLLVISMVGYLLLRYQGNITTSKEQVVEVVKSSEIPPEISQTELVDENLQAEEISPFTPEIAQAYYDVLKSAIGDYGVCEQTDYGITGIVYVELIDFDSDGIPELLFINNHDGGLEVLDYHIYGYSKMAELLYQYTVMLGRTVGEIEILSEKNGMRYLLENVSTGGWIEDRHWSSWNEHNYFTMDNGKWVSKMLRRTDYYDDQAISFHVNGEETTEEAFENAPETELGIIGTYSDIGKNNIPFDASIVYVVLAELERIGGIEHVDTDFSSQEEVGEPKTVRIDADGGLRMRSGPSADYEIIKVIPKNAYAELVEGEKANPDWLYVHYGGDYGWVSKEFLVYEKRPRSNQAPNWTQVYYDYLSKFEIMTYTYGSFKYTLPGHVLNGERRISIFFDFKNFPGYDYPVLVSAEGFADLGVPDCPDVIYLIENGKIVPITADTDSVKLSTFMGGNPDERAEVKGSSVVLFNFKNNFPDASTESINAQKAELKKALDWLKTQM